MKGRAGPATRLRARGGVALAMAMAGAGCRGNGTSIAAPCALAARHEAHACLHAKEGPFVAIDGKAAPPARLTALHTLHRVDLKGAAEGTGAEVTFVAARDGCYAFFTTPGVTLEPRAEESGGARRWIAVRPVTRCPAALMRAQLLAARAGDLIALALGGHGLEAGLLVERITGLEAARGPGGSDEGCDAGSGDAGSDEGRGAGMDGEGCVGQRPQGGVDAKADMREAGEEQDARRKGEAEAPASVAADAADAGASEGGTSGRPESDTLAPACRRAGSCTRDDECCDHCHDGDHCH